MYILSSITGRNKDSKLMLIVSSFKKSGKQRYDSQYSFLSLFVRAGKMSREQVVIYLG